MKDFRTLKVWEKAHALVQEIYKLTARFPADERFGLTIQMRRSGAAIPTHMAEGCRTDNDQDMARLFQMAMRSACELEYQLLLSRDLTYTPMDLYAELEPRVTEVKKMLTSYLQRVRAGNFRPSSFNAESRSIMVLRTDCEGFHRRDFLQVGAAGLLGLSLPSFLAAEAQAKAANSVGPKAKAKSVILVWLSGGPATIDMWDNKPEAPEGIRGEFKSIDTSAKGIQFAETLPKMAAVANKATVVRSLYHTIPSHGPATVFMTTGNKPSAALQYPAMGSIASKMLPTDLGIPPYVTFIDMRNGLAGNAGYLGTGYNPFTIEGNAGGKGADKADKGAAFRLRGITLPNGFTLDELEKRDQLLTKFDDKFRTLDKNNELVDGLDTFHKQAIEILRSDKTKKAFNLNEESQKTRDAYGTSTLAPAALAARRLVEAGVRFVTLGLGGWDTHQKTFDAHKSRLIPALDGTLAALIADLDQRGMLDSTIVICAGEFGRTPKINKNAGRDHWARSMACVIAGGGFKRGYAHGTTDASGMAPATDPVTPDDVAATVFNQLGIKPDTEIQSPTGRPIQLFREGKVQDKMIA